MGFLDKLTVSRNTVMSISLLDLKVYEDRREQLPTQGEEAEPEGRALYKGSWEMDGIRVYENGIKAKFGTLVKHNDDSGKLPAGDIVVVEKVSTFVPFEHIRAVHPVEYTLRPTGYEDRTLLGLQFETDDMRVLVISLPREKMAEEAKVLMEAMGDHWKWLYRQGEVVTGEVRLEGFETHSYKRVRGNLYLPSEMRDGRLTTPFPAVPRSGRDLPQHIKQLLDLDLTQMDDKELRQWDGSLTDYIEGAEGWSRMEDLNGPGPLDFQKDLLERIVALLGGAEASRGIVPPTPRAYHAMASELVKDQFSLDRDPEGNDTVRLGQVRRKDCERALSLLIKAMKAYPYHLESLRLKSLVHFLMGDVEKASEYRAAYDGISETIRRVKEASLAIGNADIGNFQASLEFASKAARKARKDPCAWYILGCAHHLSGNGRRAVNAYKRCLKLAPDSVLGWLGMGIALEVMGRKSEAASCLSRA